MVDEPDETQKGDGEDEPANGGPAGAALVGPVPSQGGEEGGDDEGEEDEARALGGPVEELVDEDGEGGVPGREEGGLEDGADQGGEEAAGREHEFEGFEGVGGAECGVGDDGVVVGDPVGRRRRRRLVVRRGGLFRAAEAGSGPAAAGPGAAG